MVAVDVCRYRRRRQRHAQRLGRESMEEKQGREERPPVTIPLHDPAGRGTEESRKEKTKDEGRHRQ